MAAPSHRSTGDGDLGGDVSDRRLDAIAARITGHLNRTVAGIFATGQELLDAKAALSHGSWMRLFQERRVPLSEDTAERFMAIARAKDRLLPNSAHVRNLPPSYATLYELQRLPDDTLAWAFAEGKVTPNLQRKDIPKLTRAFAGEDTTPAPDEDEAPHADWSQLTPDELSAARFKADAATYAALRKAWCRYPMNYLDVFVENVSVFLDSIKGR